MPDLSDFEFKEEPKVKSSIEITSEGGEFQTGQMSRPIELASDWDTVLEGFGLDPTVFYVVDDTVRMSKWQTSKRTEDGNRDVVWLYSYKARFARRKSADDSVDVDALCKLVEKRKPAKVTPAGSDRAFLVALSDWQLGKGEGGGTPATVERILGALDRSVAKAKELRKVGRGSDTVVLAGLGDIVEGCSGWYPMQEWQTDLNAREQDRLARRLLLNFIDAYVDAEFKVLAVCVPGNHGENRKDGKAFTDFTDNRDVSCFETVDEILSANRSRYENVTIGLEAINEDDLTATIELGGLSVAFAHGHQFRSGANAPAKMEGWWKGQALGRTGVASAHLLICGHGHHFAMSESTGRVVCQVPAMDGGSKWWTSTTGQSSPAGMLTMNVGRDSGPRGWGDLAIL